MKKKITLVVSILMIGLVGVGQTAEEFFESAAEKGDSGDYQGAISDFTKAIELDSLYVRAYGGRAVNQAKLKNFQEAIADFTKAIELENSYVKGFVGRGIYQAEIGNYKESILDFTEAIELDSSQFVSYLYDVN